MEENENGQNREQQGVVRSTTNQVKNRAVKQGAKKAREKITKEATQKVATSVAKKSALAAAAPVLGIVAVIVLVIVLAIGIASFLVTMPGLAVGELKKLAYDFGKNIASYFGADSTEMVDEDEINKLLDYLDNMGYDLKGYGFLTGYKTENDTDDNGYLDEDLGVIRYKEAEGTREADSIKKAESEYLFDYMVSDNYIYTVKNFNLDTMDGDHWYDVVFGVAKAIFARAAEMSPFSHLANFDEEWGKGMIAIYHEGSKFGEQGEFYHNEFLGDHIEVDYDEKLLKIKRGFGGDTYEYKLDGWLGRYGVPVDFLLSLHLGTMMPDLAVDIGTSFPTEVIILLHPQDASGEYEAISERVDEDENSQEGDSDRYIPYILKVKDHWYRDVYFVKDDDKQFVQTDLDYENIMRERWTLYEVHESGELAGEYKLYAIDSMGKYAQNTSQIRNYDRAQGKFTQENGMYLFNGTVEEANELGLDVTKKAVAQTYSDEDYEDSDWINSDGIWTAYKAEDGGSVTQKGEALRTETNPTIKQIFLYNRYFRYDGSPDTAKAITELKNKYNIQDGALDLTYDLSNGTDALKDKKTTIETEDGNKKEYSIEDVSGKVVINQDSLNAFTMLENTNTLDSDYIYRDFKELIVELGYFTKEELAEETPRLLEWVIPDVGSCGYPYRVIDKRENEFGSMIHSNGDKEAAFRYTISELVAGIGEHGEDVPGDLQGSNDEQASLNKSSNSTKKLASSTRRKINDSVATVVSGRKNDLSSSGISEDFLSEGNNEIRENKVLSAGSKKETGHILPESDGSVDVASVSVDEFLAAAREMCEYINKEGYDYCVLGDGSPQGYSCNHSAHGNGCCLPTRFSDSQKDVSQHNMCCATLVAWALQNVGVMADEDHCDNDQAVAEYCLSHLDCEKIEVGAPLEPGDIFVYNGHIDLLGEEIDDGYVKYNGGHCTPPGSVEPDGGSCIEHVSGWPGDGRIMYAIRINWGGKKKPGDVYDGYYGNEAVVSPVTGILLDYGTYGDSASQKDERTNIDLKYGSPILSAEQEGSAEKGLDGEIVVDKVGYAKILVLDPTNYYKLEKSTNNSWKNNSLVKLKGDSGTYIDDERVSEKNGTKNWSDIDNTVYGYKEFAEDYVEGGIAGNIVYVDGFRCEDVDEELESRFNEKNRKNIAKEIPNNSEGAITIDDFKISEGQLDDDDAQRPNQFEEQENYRSVSKKQTLKINNEESLKTKAASSISINYDGKDLIFIKEGTVLGRTITDKELLESSNYRNSQHGTYEEKREQKNEEGEVESEVIGNYVRVIFRDKDDTVIENVEDYMKLDDGLNQNKTLGSIEQFMYWQAKEPEGFEYIIDGEQSYALTSSGGASRRDNPSDKYGHDYGIDDGGAGDDNLCPGMWMDPGSSGREIFEKVTGQTPVRGVTFATGTQLLDIYTQELQLNMEEVRNAYPITETLDDEDTRLFALMDVMYAGPGNFVIGTIDDKLLAGNLDLTKEDFLSNCTGENPFYTQNPNGFTRRRLHDYYMYSKGYFCHDIYDSQGDEITQRWEFKSETPFQDLMMDKEGAELVDM